MSINPSFNEGDVVVWASIDWARAHGLLGKHGVGPFRIVRAYLDQGFHSYDAVDIHNPLNRPTGYLYGNFKLAP